tara:strand:- start:67 stop:828 length:762 start_codon:yes stop_codon:yes gene_type:complete
MYLDRMVEIRDFFDVSWISLLIFYIRNGTPNTNYFKTRLDSFFQICGTDEINLKKAYDSSSFYYVNRLMLRYHNYGIGKKAEEIISLITPERSLQEVHVLDYGCGVADPTLFLALKGAAVTIVDLDNKKFEFAEERFTQRNLDVNAWPATDTERPIMISPDIQYDFIIMAEFLEHVRKPRRFLEFALSHLRKGGLFYDPLGPIHKHGVGGDHLMEAKLEMETTDYATYYKEHLVPVNLVVNKECFDHFYVKRD